MERRRPNKTGWQKFIEILSFDIKSGSNRASFFEALSTLLVSGIDIRTILTELKKEATSKSLTTLINDIQIDIENGTPLWRVIQYYKLVPAHYVSLIKIGEQTGNLPRNMEIVVNQMEHDRDFKDKIRSASLYPSIVAGMLIIVTFALMTFVMPKITSVYTSLKVELPLITKVMIKIGDILSANVLVTVSVFIIFMSLLIYFLFYNQTTKRTFTQLIFRSPGLGRILQETEIARMGYILSSLLRSGISLPESFKLMQKATELRDYIKFYGYAANFIEKGYTLELILNSYEHIGRILPLYPRQLIINGEKSRSLEKNLDNIADIYAKKNEISLKDINTIFEPVMLIIVWIGVTIFAISVIMPIYSILGNISDVAEGGNVNQVPAATPMPDNGAKLNYDVNSLTDNSPKN